MDKEKNTWIDAVTKMIKLTNSGKLRWESRDDNDIAKIPPVLYTTYKQHQLKLYKHMMRPLPTLEMIGENDVTLWTFPKIEALADLFKAAKFQIAGVKNFLDGILNEE
jgi:hypothetical protein